ncbi:MAG: hypothetical protein JWN62_1649 [Acidimicrobiales bacterium]|nr:hypothetical protein [Acidimicrobiales bacterium]
MHPHRTTTTSTMWRSALVLVALAAGAASCSSNAKSAETTAAAPASTAPRTTQAATTTAATEAPTTTTEVPTTTTDALQGTTGRTVPETTTTLPPETTTTLPPEPVYPLTGLPNPDPAIAARPALIVKIDNAPGARPQSGFNEADIVVEEIVNDNLTRFAMVFQSGNASAVGPIRSGRLQDVNIFSSLDHPLFAWSGGNKTVTDTINASELINIGPSKAAVYYRTHDKAAPHNLYSSTDALFGRAVEGEPAAKQQFEYRAADAAPGGSPSPGVGISLDSIDVRWDWNASTGLYERTMEGKAHNDALSGRVTTNNVVVLAMEYVPGISHSPDAQVLGGGEAFVFTGGNYIHAQWVKQDIHDPFSLLADDGTPILLTPGRTFIELPRIGHTLVIPAS